MQLYVFSLIIIGVLLVCGTPIIAFAENTTQNIVASKSVVENIKLIYIQKQEEYKEIKYQQKIQQVKTIAEQYLGTPYVWGGTSPRGFDCSGFTQYVYRECGIDIPRTARTQKNCSVSVPIGELVCGDLIFWGTHHVGLYIGDGLYIHAPQSGDVVKIESIYKRMPTSACRLIFKE